MGTGESKTGKEQKPMKRFVDEQFISVDSWNSVSPGPPEKPHTIVHRKGKREVYLLSSFCPQLVINLLMFLDYGCMNAKQVLADRRWVEKHKMEYENYSVFIVRLSVQ